MGGYKLKLPDRLPKQGVPEADLQAWWHELMNYLNQDEDFQHFKKNGLYSTWIAAEINEDRIIDLDESDANTTLNKRRVQLNNYLVTIAGTCYRGHYMMVLNQATSIQWIYNEMKILYQLENKGKDFVNIVNMKFNPATDSAITFYNDYRAKIIENLQPAGTKLQWKTWI